MSGTDHDRLIKYLVVAIFIVAVLVCILTAAVLLKPQTVNQTVNNSSRDSSGEITVLPAIRFNLTPLAGDGNVSDSQLEQAKIIIAQRLGEYGPASSVTSMRDEEGNAFVVLAFYNATSRNDLVSLITAPGKFEIRVRTAGNDSRHILYGDDIRNASFPIGKTLDNETTLWSVIFNMTDKGALKFRQTCIEAGATRDPDLHPVMMLLDDRLIYSGSLSTEVARNMVFKPMDSLMVTTGTGDNAYLTAQKVSACLQAGSLPVKVEVS